MCQKRSSRQEARARLDAAYFKMRDRMLPADESQPVKDGLFWEWEEMADEFDREVTGRLLEELAGSRVDGRYLRLLNHLAKYELLILDDWCAMPLVDEQRRALFEILEDRYDRSSTLVASQVPVEKWHEALGDPTLADAILDRLVHNAHKIIIKGESMRKTRRGMKKFAA